MITLTRQFVIIIPLSFILLPLIGLNGIWLTFPLSELIATCVAFILYQKFTNIQKQEMKIFKLISCFLLLRIMRVQ